MKMWRTVLAAAVVLAAAGDRDAWAQWRDITYAESRIVVDVPEVAGAARKAQRADQYASSDAGGLFPTADHVIAANVDFAVVVTYAEGTSSRSTWRLPSWEDAIRSYPFFRDRTLNLGEIRDVVRPALHGRDIGPTLYRRVSYSERGHTTECVFFAHAYDQHWMRGYMCALRGPLQDLVAVRAIRAIGVKNVIP